MTSAETSNRPEPGPDPGGGPDDGHPDDGTLMAWVDGELSAAVHTDVEAHLDRCAGCSRRVSALRDASHRLSRDLKELDVEPPATSPPRPGGWRAARPLPRRATAAAALLLFVAGAASAAIPGSPVRGWLADAGQWMTERLSEADAPAPAVEPAPPEGPDVEVDPGVQVTPLQGSVRISITSLPPDALLRIRLVDDERAGAWVREANFRAGPGTIDIWGAEGDVRIHLPRTVEASVSIGGRAVVRLEDGELSSRIPVVAQEEDGLVLRPRE